MSKAAEPHVRSLPERAIAELEKILQEPDTKVTINPDDSVTAASR